MDTQQQIRVSEPGEFTPIPKIQVWGTEGWGRGGSGTVMVRRQELLPSWVGWRAAPDLPAGGRLVHSCTTT